jgi:hypothetical protein
MSEYHFKPGERVPDGVKRIVQEEIESAVRQLSGQEAARRDEAIHEARKSVKKIRGVLRLIQPEMGDIYALENALFRDIGRHLSQFRDAGAVVETFDALRKKYRGDLEGRSLAGIRRRLITRKTQAEKQSNIGEVLSNMAAALERSAARLSAWPLSKDGFPAIAPGLEATFRRGQKAMARARKHPRPENYHEWRNLEAALGEDHNLVVLHDKVLAEPEFYGKKAEIRVFGELIAKYHDALRDDASDLGARIYDGKPGRFTRRIERLWDDWESKPAN